MHQASSGQIPHSLQYAQRQGGGDFNPIENAFAKLKALRLKAAERMVGVLQDQIGTLLDAFTPAECANYFGAAGYEPD